MSRVLALIALAAIIFSGCTRSSGPPDESLNRVKQAGVLRVAIDPSYPPFAFLDNSGQIAGYDADLSRELASRLGVKATFVPMDVTTVFDALIARKADAAISAVSPAWEYAKEIGFSPGYFNAGQVLLLRKGERQVASPAELDTGVLGVEIGSTGELEGRKLAQTKPGISLVPYDSPELAIGALSSGKVDGVITDRVTAAVLLQQENGVRLGGEPFTNEPYVIAVKGSERALLSQIDTILETMASEGFLRGLDRRWIGPES